MFPELEELKLLTVSLLKSKIAKKSVVISLSLIKTIF